MDGGCVLDEDPPAVDDQDELEDQRDERDERGQRDARRGRRLTAASVVRDAARARTWRETAA